MVRIVTVFGSLALGGSLLPGHALPRPPLVCALGDLDVPALEGWEPHPVPDPPEGLAGCVLLRADTDGNLAGVVRAKSAARTLKGYERGAYETLLDQLAEELAGMNVSIGPWSEATDVPSQEESLTGGKLYRAEGKIADNPTAQTIWTVVLTGPRYYYVFSIVSPNERDYPEYWEKNKEDFTRLLAALRLTRPGR
jgi:hypothetical protein